MTYEEYKSGSKKKSIIKSIISKLITLSIIIMITLIISNYSPKFKSFINDNVLNNTMDFSFVNKLMNKVTDIFSNNKDTPVFSLDGKEPIKYMDGVKYVLDNESDVILKDSGIVTFIGLKEGYKNTVIVQQSNGYYAWYGNVNESIKLYDYVEKGTSIGTSRDEYYYVLLKDDKPIDILNEN